MATELTTEQKRQLFHDGYIVLKGAVSADLVEAARARIEAAERAAPGTSPVFRPRDESLSPAEELTDLVNKSTVTPIRMGPGDAAITIFQMPHTGTRNQFGTESRKNMIFRIRNKSRQPDKVVTGVSDHPDRGQFGEWLEYEEGNDPWQRSKHALTHMWHEWEGMQDIVAAEQPTLTPIDFGAVS